MQAQIVCAGSTGGTFHPPSGEGSNVPANVMSGFAPRGSHVARRGSSVLPLCVPGPRGVMSRVAARGPEGGSTPSRDMASIGQPISQVSRELGASTKEARGRPLRAQIVCAGSTGGTFHPPRRGRDLMPPHGARRRLAPRRSPGRTPVPLRRAAVRGRAPPGSCARAPGFVSGVRGGGWEGGAEEGGRGACGEPGARLGGGDGRLDCARGARPWEGGGITRGAAVRGGPRGRLGGGHGAWVPERLGWRGVRGSSVGGRARARGPGGCGARRAGVGGGAGGLGRAWGAARSEAAAPPYAGASLGRARKFSKS